MNTRNVKKNLGILGLASCMLLVYAHANTQNDLKQAYQTATVVSATKIPSTGDYAYEVSIRLNCTLYVARYKSANDYVPFPVNSPLDVRVGKDSIYTSASDQQIELPLVKSASIADKSCPSQPESASEVIPAGTILPVRLDTTLRSNKSQPGEIVRATIMQDVDLGNEKTLRKGSVVTGHVLQASNPGNESDQALLSFQFDQVRFDDREVSITTVLRALASSTEVEQATVPKGNADGTSSYSSDLVQIGGDQTSYGSGAVMVGQETVGKYTSQGVVAHFITDVESECRGVTDGNTRPQAFWLFSVNACGTYGIDGAKIIHAGRGDPVGQATVASHRTLEIRSGSGMLLRVGRSVPEEAVNSGQRN